MSPDMPKSLNDTLIRRHDSMKRVGRLVGYLRLATPPCMYLSRPKKCISKELLLKYASEFT